MQWIWNWKKRFWIRNWKYNVLKKLGFAHLCIAKTLGWGGGSAVGWGGSVSDPKSNTGGLGGYHPSTNNAQSGIQYGCECRPGLGHWLRPRNQPFDLGGRRISIKPNLAGDRRCRRKLPTTTRLIKTSRLGNASKAQNRGVYSALFTHKASANRLLDQRLISPVWLTSYCSIANRLLYSSTTDVTHTKWWSFWPCRMMELYNWRCRMHEISLRKP